METLHKLSTLSVHFQLTIYNDLEPIVVEFDEAENQKHELGMGKNGVSVSIEDRQVKFRINASHWTDSDASTIESFINEKFANSDFSLIS